MTTPLPSGFGLVPDRTTRTAGDVVWGGTTVLRLTPAGASLARSLLAGEPVEDKRAGLLARRLLNAGLAHPVPPDVNLPIEVVVPAHDRPELLSSCLEALAGLPVTVVDDASRNSGAVAAVARRFDAQVVLRARNGGPAAARNTGLATTTASVVAFVDSDATVSAEVLRQLARQFADPEVAAVAPRIGDPLLDMGAHPANVRPATSVSYVPATVVVVRRTAIDGLGGFDESLRYGEDVDLVWRLVQRGWSVRYDPTLSASHVCGNRLARGFAYGTSVGPLSQRHATALRGPALAGMIAPMRLRTFLGTGLPAPAAVRIAATAPIRTAVALGRWAVPMSADDVAYTLGMWRGCVASRTARPLLPRLR